MRVVSFASGRRLRGRQAFVEVFRRGLRATGPSLTLIYQPRAAQPLRPAVVISSRVRPHVRRSLLKRRLRELVLLHGELLPPSGGALVVLYRGDAARPFKILHQDYLRTLGALRRCCPA